MQLVVEKGLEIFASGLCKFQVMLRDRGLKLGVDIKYIYFLAQKRYFDEKFHVL